MKIGTVRETKKHESRVGLTPACVQAYIRRGHQVLVETGAGACMPILPAICSWTIRRWRKCWETTHKFV